MIPMLKSLEQDLDPKAKAIDVSTRKMPLLMLSLRNINDWNDRLTLVDKGLPN